MMTRQFCCNLLSDKIHKPSEKPFYTDNKTCRKTKGRLMPSWLALNTAIKESITVLGAVYDVTVITMASASGIMAANSFYWCFHVQCLSIRESSHITMIYIKTKLIYKKALYQNNHWIYNLEFAAYHSHCFSWKESIITNVKAGKKSILKFST